MQEIVINQLSVHRTRLQCTQEEVGRAVGVTRQTIIALEKGNYTPSVLSALKLAEYFRVRVEELFEIKK